MLLIHLVCFGGTLDVETGDGDLLVDVFLCFCEMSIHCLHPEVLQSLLEELRFRALFISVDIAVLRYL